MSVHFSQRGLSTSSCLQVFLCENVQRLDTKESEGEVKLGMGWGGEEEHLQWQPRGEEDGAVHADVSNLEK